MKTKPSPLATMSKRRQRRKLHCDTLRFQKQGGQIRHMTNGTARGLCSIQSDNLELTSGFYCEI